MFWKKKKQFQLERFYDSYDISGDDAWRDLVTWSHSLWPKCPNQQELIDAYLGDIEIAQLAYAHLLNDALAWASSDDSEALDFVSPQECLRTGLRKRIQVALMRMGEFG